MKQRLPSQRRRLVGSCLAKASVWSPLSICWLAPPDSP
ncbi:hypothetical protein PVAP13_1KG549101 [Panicum virgatum]|uniref:Uncharacterized protein n=1 Tax=Panicum virgatum TaxID=38727 RepID=A0A8T0Y5K8_PANVG|nr:hypothetical protein PVAP13_1KG549101 [Panicum virgatum]